MDTSLFLSTCAQVIPAIVIALLVEDRLYSAAGHSANHPQTGQSARRRQLMTLNIGMVVAVIGEFAALIGLLIGGLLWIQVTTLTSIAILALMLVLPLIASLRQEFESAPGTAGPRATMKSTLGHFE